MKNKFKFEIGDVVKITSLGDVYSYYQDFFIKMNFKNHQENSSKSKDTNYSFVIENRDIHPDDKLPIYKIVNKEFKRELLFAEEGLESSSPFLTIEPYKKFKDEMIGWLVKPRERYFSYKYFLPKTKDFKRDETTKICKSSVDTILNGEAFSSKKEAKKFLVLEGKIGYWAIEFLYHNFDCSKDGGKTWEVFGKKPK